MAQAHHAPSGDPPTADDGGPVVGRSSHRPPPRPRLGVGPFSLRQVTAAIAVVALAAVALTLAVRPLGSIAPGLPVPEASAYLLRDPIPGLGIGSLAPELAVQRSDGTTFQLADLDGQPIRLADLRGKVVWLNFWASWCPPCQAETPILRTMDQRYRDRGLALIGVQVQQIVADGQRYARTYSLRYRIGADVSGDIFRAYRVFALPTQFFIDGSGILREIVNGPLDEATASAIVEALLAGASASP
jgi:cytochrome c biogenesis protein CcmG/thiol:disulfide interchange protein DsbE